MELTNILNAIDNSVNIVQNLTVSLPAILSRCIAIKRSGLSSKRLTSNIIAKLPSAGIPNGVNTDGSPNIINMMVRVISEGVVDEIKNNLRIEGVMDSGTLKIVTAKGDTGTNPTPSSIIGYAR